MSSSHIPVLNDVLFYTETDSYDYLTDNRPIYQLDTNVRSIASAMVGMGYGEHSSLDGGLLTPGNGVELLSNGQIRYPLSTTAKVLGLVIGATGAGLTKVVWASNLLDLATIGLGSKFPGVTAGSYILVNPNGTGALYTSTTTVSTDLVLGTLKENTYVTIGTQPSNSIAGDPAPKINHANMYGVSRVRNMMLMESLDSTPVQFSKSTYRQASFATINPLNISFDSATGEIAHGDIFTGYESVLSAKWVIKEKYTRYLNTNSTEKANYNTTDSSWVTTSYATTLSGSDNYDLQSLNGYEYYSTTARTEEFKKFNISVYYSYPQVVSSVASYGKPSAKITVFDPQGSGQGGEPGLIMVCEFITYDAILGLETQKHRVVLMGVAATSLYSDINIFPYDLVTL